METTILPLPTPGPILQFVVLNVLPEELEAMGVDRGLFALPICIVPREMPTKVIAVIPEMLAGRSNPTAIVIGPVGAMFAEVGEEEILVKLPAPERPPY